MIARGESATATPTATTQCLRVTNGTKAGGLERSRLYLAPLENSAAIGFSSYKWLYGSL
jgi:hypothetical protein